MHNSAPTWHSFTLSITTSLQKFCIQPFHFSNSLFLTDAYEYAVIGVFINNLFLTGEFWAVTPEARFQHNSMKLFSIGVLLLAAFQITLGAAADSTVSAPACGVSLSLAQKLEIIA